MNAGELAPDALVTEAIRPILKTRDDYVLDGFPRRLAQAEGVDFDVVVFLDVPLDVVTAAPARPRPRGRHAPR